MPSRSANHSVLNFAREFMIDYDKALQRGEGRGEGLRQVQLRCCTARRGAILSTGPPLFNRANGPIWKEEDKAKGKRQKAKIDLRANGFLEEARKAKSCKKGKPMLLHRKKVSFCLSCTFLSFLLPL